MAAFRVEALSEDGRCHQFRYCTIFCVSLSSASFLHTVLPSLRRCNKSQAFALPKVAYAGPSRLLTSAPSLSCRPSFINFSRIILIPVAARELNSSRLKGWVFV